MAEETKEQISADDWGAAMAEQAASAPAAQPAVFEQFGAEMLRRADAGMAISELAGLRAGQRDVQDAGDPAADDQDRDARLQIQPAWRASLWTC